MSINWFIIVGIIVLFLGIVAIEKYWSNSRKIKTKDYSSDRLQDRKFFKDLFGFSFEGEVSKKQIKNDLLILDNVLKNAKTMPDSKKLYLKKLAKKIKNGKLIFKDGLTYEKAVNLINMSCDDIMDLVTSDKQRILRKVFGYSDEYQGLNDEILDNGKMHGLNKEDLRKWYSFQCGRKLVYNGFINDEQYNSLFEILKISDRNNKKDVEFLASKLTSILTEEQKETLNKLDIFISAVALSLLDYGRNTFFHISNLRRVLPERFWDEKDKEPLIKILKGIDVFESNEVVKKDVNLKPNKKSFLPESNISKPYEASLKNVLLADVNKNHNEAVDVLKHAQRRYIPIPKTLVTFDTHSDIFVNTKITTSIADWVNTVISKYCVSDVYWVVPDEQFFYIENVCHYFGENVSDAKEYKGNYDINNVYQDFSKPLKQTFLFEVETSIIVSESVMYTKKEIKEKLKTGKYRLVNIYTCTQKTLPKLNKPFILSVDADYFTNSGFDTFFYLENMPIDLKKVFERFLKCYAKKLQKASIISYTISPEYISFDALGEVRGFYEYMLSAIRKKSKKMY